ncbi:MAG: putative neutral metalloprotease [Frankiales bacterium]|nr:putative neutral metalloprotease [Frankiales bacterium]
MRLRLVAPAALLALGCAALPTLADDRVVVTAVGADSVLGDLGPARGAAASWARRALAAQADRLGVDPSAFVVDSVRTSLLGTHVRGTQVRGGVPVRGGSLLVTAVDDRVVQVTASEVDLPGLPAARPVGEVVARAAALDRLRATSLLAPAAVQRSMVARAGRLVDVYRVSVVARTPARAAVVEVDAASGRVLAVQDDARRVDGSALVFDPNPIVTAKDNTLRQPLEAGLPADVEVPDAALDALRRKLPLRELDDTALATGRLSGPWVNVLSGGYVGLTPDFDVSRADPRFEGLMAYAHLDRLQRYFVGLGLDDVNAEPQDVVAVPVPGYDNSFYQPGNDLMVLGGGGVDDGEDADVVVHEYGHAVQDAQVPGWGETPEGGAMGEGFGDFLSASVQAPTSGGYQDLCVADWDATSYSTATPPCLRRLDSPKRYPSGIEGEVHADGELWSAFLWRVRGALHGDAVVTEQTRSDDAVRLVLSSHELLTPQADFAQAVQALRTAAVVLGHPEWEDVVVAEARRTGFRVS